MMNRRRFIQIGATSVLALSCHRMAFAKAITKSIYALSVPPIFTVF